MATRSFLFVDQVGSTRQLAELGDAGGQKVRRALFDLLRQVLESSGGQEVDFTGDGLFCAFDGAVEAVDAAIAMQQVVWSFNGRHRELDDLAIRVGLHAGEPLESEGGGYFGIAVVVASRLCAAANASQILASDLIRLLVTPRAAYSFGSPTVLALKGVPDPVTAFAVEWRPDGTVGVLPPLIAQARNANFVGRTRELDSVARAFADALAGRRRLVLVSGDHGMGVTRFMAEVAARCVDMTPSTVWAGSGGGTGTGGRGQDRLALWAQALTEWTRTTSRADLRLVMGDRANELLRIAPEIDRIIPGLVPPASVSPDTETFVVADALDDLCVRWSQHEPIVVVLDRLDEADEATLTVVRRLVESDHPARLLIMAGYEPSRVGTPRVLAGLGQVRHAVDVRLTALGDEDVRELIVQVSGEPVSDASVRAVISESEGNPYFVKQMALAFKERSLTQQVGQAVERAQGLRTDLRLQREEIELGLAQLSGLRSFEIVDPLEVVEPDGTGPADVACPYPGLLAFETENAADFFGRELLVAEMAARLLASRFLAVVGPSASGKSSAVRAGLLPALGSGAVPGSESWRQLLWIAGTDSVEALSDQLVETGPAVVVIDQAEQLWAGIAADGRDQVLDRLVAAVEDPSAQMAVVLVLRADYYGRVAEHPPLAALVDESHILVAAMTRSELRRAIEGPARTVGLVLEPGLAQAVIDDVGSEPGGLAFLSTALRETWERRRGRSLTLTGYAETGGAKHAIAQLADTTYLGLDDAERETARRLLLRLATPATGDIDIARPAPLSEVSADPTAQRVLAVFAEHRLVVVNDETVQVAHEALLREWPRLREWLVADRQGRRLEQRVANAAGEWAAAGRDDELLLRGAVLAGAEERHIDHGGNFSPLEAEFVAASLQARSAGLRAARRRARRLQALAAVLALLLVVTAVVGVIAINARRDATQRANESDARGLAAQAFALSTSNTDTSLLLAAEGYRRDPSIDTESGLLSALNGARFLVRYHDELPRDVADLKLAAAGSTLLLLTEDGTLQRYDTATWKPKGTPIATHIDSPIDVSVSPDGTLAYYTDGAGVHVFNVASGNPIGVFGSPGAFAAAFTNDGRTLLFGSAAKPGITSIDLTTGKPGPTLAADLPQALVAVNPATGEVLGSSGFGDTIQRYTLAGAAVGAPVHVLEGITDVEYTPDGQHVVITAGASAEFLDATTLVPVGSPMTVRGARATDDSFDPSGNLMALSSDDGSISVIDVAQDSVIATTTGLTGDTSVQFLADDHILATTAGRVAEYSLDQIAPVGQPSFTKEPVYSLLAAGSTLIAGEADQVVRLVAPLTEQPIAPFTKEPTAPDVGLSADGKLLAVHDYPNTALTGGRVRIMNLASGQIVQTVTSTADIGNATRGGRVAFSPDGSRLAVGTASGYLEVLNVATGAVMVSLAQVDPVVVGTLTWSPDGSTLLVGGQQGVLEFVNPATGAVIRSAQLSPGSDLTGAVYLTGAVGSAAHDIAVSSESGEIYLVDATTGKLDGAPLTAGGGTQLQGLALLPGGSWIAAVSRDGDLRLWDIASRRAIGPPVVAHEAADPAIVVTADGRLLTGGVDEAIINWQLTPQAWEAT